MSDVPTLVALYTYAPGKPTRIAEFRWSAEGGVTLTILDPEWTRVARTTYDDGISLDRERRMVRPDEGPVFMRGLLAPRNMTYYAFIDESPG